jgi:hypothetical protein
VAVLAALAFLLGILLPAVPGPTFAAAPMARAGTAADSARQDPGGWVRADRADEPLATPAPRPGRTLYPIVPAVLAAGILLVVPRAHVVRRRRRTVRVRRRVVHRAPRAPPTMATALGVPA